MVQLLPTIGVRLSVTGGADGAAGGPVLSAGDVPHVSGDRPLHPAQHRLSAGRPLLRRQGEQGEGRQGEGWQRLEGGEGHVRIEGWVHTSSGHRVVYCAMERYSLLAKCVALI